MDIEAFKKTCYSSPRTNSFSTFFSSVASGQSGMPKNGGHQADVSLFRNDRKINEFHNIHRTLRGRFDPHFHSSIPYVLEEECRLGSALLDYGLEKSEQNGRDTTIYTLGTAEATMARVIGRMGQGHIKTLSCSPTIENEQSFLSYGIPENSKFFVGPFCDVDASLLSTCKYKQFEGGFDVILEDTSFQMYGSDREKQILSVLKNLKKDGCFLFTEKFLAESSEDYIRRERQKDECFKAKYFSESEINLKKSDVLNEMVNYEVSLSQFVSALRNIFDYAVITWNSGNFYTIVASSSKIELIRFISKLTRPCILSEFSYIPLPKVIIGPQDFKVDFRDFCGK